MDLFTKRVRIVIAAVLLVAAAYFSCLLIFNTDNNLLDIPERDIININTANKEELMKFEGIGEEKAKRIIEYREEKGKFEKPEDIMNVDGIGEHFFKYNKKNIAV